MCLREVYRCPCERGGKTTRGGHTADVIFFKVEGSKLERDKFVELVKAEFPHWLDGKEHSYLQTGADIGDQGLALAAMGAGSLLGLWKLLTPRSVLGKDCPDDICMQMAGMGMITIKADQ